MTTEAPSRPASPRPPRSRTFRVLVPVVAASPGCSPRRPSPPRGVGSCPASRTTCPGWWLTAKRRSRSSSGRRRAAARRSTGRPLRAASGSRAVRAVQSEEAALARTAGLTARSGPGLVVSLDDAPRSARTRSYPAGMPSPSPNDLVVHQQDVQSVLNGLRAGGASALSVMGQRVIATTAVRCVGNTLLVSGRVYSPPFVIAALGDPGRLRAALEAEPGVQIFQQYVARTGCTWTSPARAPSRCRLTRVRWV